MTMPSNTLLMFSDYDSTLPKLCTLGLALAKIGTKCKKKLRGFFLKIGPNRVFVLGVSPLAKSRFLPSSPTEVLF